MQRALLLLFLAGAAQALTVAIDCSAVTWTHSMTATDSLDELRVRLERCKNTTVMWRGVLVMEPRPRFGVSVFRQPDDVSGDECVFHPVGNKLACNGDRFLTQDEVLVEPMFKEGWLSRLIDFTGSSVTITTKRNYQWTLDNWNGTFVLQLTPYSVVV
jgi:hypothetical protein